MANTKTSAMTAATGLLLADEFPINEAGVSKKITGTLLSNSFPYLISTLSGASATYAFTTIAATWRELELRFYLRDTSGAVGLNTCAMTLNGDGGANYYQDILQVHGTTTTVPSEALTATAFNFNAVGGGSTANLHAAGVFRLAGYKGAGIKTIELRYTGTSALTTTNVQNFLAGGVWNSTAAVTSITLTPGTGFGANSYAELWGWGS